MVVVVVVVSVEKVRVVDTVDVAVEVTPGGMIVLVDVEVIVDVTVEVGVAAVIVLVVLAVVVVVLVITASTSLPQMTDVGYNCGEIVHLPFGESLATTCGVVAARAARPMASRALTLGTYPGSCWMAVNPGGAGTVDVPPSFVVVVLSVSVSVAVDVEVIVDLCVPIKGFKSVLV